MHIYFILHIVVHFQHMLIDPMHKNFVNIIFLFILLRYFAHNWT
jgi:hypothetical protein